jgi:signal transduction histidine kinase
MLPGRTLPAPQDLLLSTLLSLPDDRRAEVERLLIPVTRSAALGELATGVAHDVANPLFGAIGLVDLLLEDAAPASEDAARLQLLKETTLEMKGTLQVLLDFARSADGAREASLDDALRTAIRLLAHGGRRTTAVEARYGREPSAVPCSPGALLQAVLQLLLAAREVPGLVAEVSGATLRLSPAPPETLGTLVAARIVTDHGGKLERDADSLSVCF